jgi:mannose-6-phosphate isomerase-like protein (cupin superfamily)
MAIISTDNAEHYTWGQQCHGWHLVKTEQLSVIQECVPMGSSEVRHYHRKVEQFFYILSGIASLELDGTQHTLVAGQGLHVSAGLAHRLSNDHKQDLVFIVTSTPPSHGDRVNI